MIAPYWLHNVDGDDGSVPDHTAVDRDRDSGFTVTYLRCALAIVHGSLAAGGSEPLEWSMLNRLRDSAHAFAIAAAQSELQTTVSTQDAQRLRQMLGRFIDHEMAGPLVP